jgi:uncharacterized protein YjiK
MVHSMRLPRLAALCSLLLPGLALRAPAAAPAAAPSAPPPASILDGYRVAAGPIKVPEVGNDLSAITFDPDTGTLFAIRNNNCRIFELDREGKLLRSFALTGYEDTEDLAYLGSGQLAVIEERRRTLSIAAIPQGGKPLARPADVRLVEPKEYGNVGLEGVAFDLKGDRFYLVKEKQPRGIYAVARAAKPDDASAVTHPWDLEAHNFGLNDISAVTLVPSNGHLLLLSDESHTIVECTADGREVGRLPLSAGSAGLAADVLRAEGIALDDQGRLYVVCEPDTFYVFTKP